jgi:hypothetical protein
MDLLTMKAIAGKKTPQIPRDLAFVLSRSTSHQEHNTVRGAALLSS